MNSAVARATMLLSTSLALSCSEIKSPDEAQQIVEEFQRVESMYRTNDIGLAEQALLQHRQYLLRKRADGIKGIDYDTALAIVSGRLFVIYEHLGDSNNAQRHLQESAERFNSRRRKNGVAVEKFTEELLAEKVSKWDGASGVRWKTNSVYRQ